MKGFEEQFRIEGLRYGLQVSETGQVAFWLEDGTTRRGKVQKDVLFEDLPVLDDVNLLTVQPMTLFRLVARRVEDWIACEKPYQVYFSTGDARRAAIYRWLAKRAVSRLPDYWYYELERSFYFFRKLDRPERVPKREAEVSALAAAFPSQ